MKASVDLLIESRWIVPIEPADTVLTDHGIAVKNGIILDILPQKELHQHYTAPHCEHYPHHALMPGLINCHTHAAMTLLKGISDDQRLKEWLEKTIWPAEKAFISEDFIKTGVRLAAAEMLLSGTTCFNDSYFLPEVAAPCIEAIGMRASMGVVILDFETHDARTPEEAFQKATRFHQQYAHSPLITPTIAPHAPYSVSETHLKTALQFAQKNNTQIHMHLQETSLEVPDIASSTQRPIAYIQSLGMLNPRLIAVHMVDLYPEEIELLKKGHPHIVHCPHSNMKLASGHCPVDELLRQGINVSLGTDGSASNNRLDLFNEMFTASLLAKDIKKDPTALNAFQALKMATLNGARTLGLEHHIGSLKPGKQADIIAVDLNTVTSIPTYHVISQLVYANTGHHVSDVWIAGQQCVKKRTLTSINMASLKEDVSYWAKKIEAKFYS